MSIIVAFVIVLGWSELASSAEDDVAKATAAAASWLALTDAGKYGEAWEAASAYLRGAVTKEAFTQQLEGVRTPLGAVESRKLLSATATHQLPGAPDGDYVVIQYETVFAKKAHAIETVTPMKEKDGSWRVAGYYIK